MNNSKKAEVHLRIKSKLENVSQMVKDMQNIELELKQLFEELDEEHQQEINTLQNEIDELKKSNTNTNNNNNSNNHRMTRSQTQRSQYTNHGKGMPSYEIPPPPSANSPPHSLPSYTQSPPPPQQNQLHYQSKSFNNDDKPSFKQQTGQSGVRKGVGPMKFSPKNGTYMNGSNSEEQHNTNNFMPQIKKELEQKKITKDDSIPAGITERDFYKKYWIEAGKIGEGAFARVRRITRKADKQVFALKMIKKKGKSSEDIAALQREITVLQKCDHPNIVRLADWCDTKKRIYMVVEFCDGGDVFERVVQFKKFSEKDAVHVIKQVASGLGHIHDLKFVHRDLKPDNLMYLTRDANSVIKIIDFGLAGDCSKASCKTPCGTAHYAAPEVLGNLPYDTTADLWSLGVIVYTLLCGFPPFFDASNNMKNLYHLIKKGQFDFPSPFWDDVSNEAKDLVKKLLVKDPKKRLKAQEILKHPWITGGNASDKDMGMKYVKQMTHWQSTRQQTEIKIGADSESVPPPPKNAQQVQLFYNQ